MKMDLYSDVRSKMAVMLLLLACVFSLAHLHDAQHTPNTTIQDLAFRNMDFAMNLYRRISSYHDKNVFFSPLSVSTSFAALSAGAGGKTRREILAGLNLHLEQPDLMPELFRQLQENITRNGSLGMDQDMAMFLKESFSVEQSFQQHMKTFFAAEVMSLNFSDSQESVRLINHFIQQKTDGRVKEMLSEVDPLTQLMLVSTIFFQGRWQKPFNPKFTEKKQFHIDSYNIVDVPMMLLEDKFYNMEDNVLGARVLKLPYQEGVSMLVLLPNKGVDYTVIDDEINAQRFLGWIQKLEKFKLEVQMPKFVLEQSYLLHDLLPELGISSVFSDAANLTKIYKDGGVKVSEVLHKAMIEVDESGTTAAAATTVGVTLFSLPMIFSVNRPFFFFIYHEDTNSLLFMGRVIDPTKK
ncbi:protein Z-dependent protease inhibitor-like isoform X1 [Synchiropus splendidus]|uniref:protein Z-dependent protease inhibitor-like isoform X1 n=2 Tax=Synchiropus splendidus TaxID=270530 RepID=UPI00237E996D|nr:protein Z-dependent protease inhibitor-like isoform X1 [Synchiropus splendidus]